MSNNPNNVIGYGGGLLINVNNTIQGAGQIGNTQMSLNNQGTINANVCGAGANPLIVNPLTGTHITNTNTGTMEATNGGTLELQANFDNTGGTIQAVGTNSIVLLNTAGTSFSGGTLTTSGGGVIGAKTSNGFPILEGMPNTVTNAGMFEVFDGAVVVVDGTINNTGTILLNGTSSGAQMNVTGPNFAATLTGKGTVTMSNFANNVIGWGGWGSDEPEQHHPGCRPDWQHPNESQQQGENCCQSADDPHY
jgi:hypothetical protein